MFGVLEGEAIETVLSHEIVGHLGCHANGTTYVVPISYAYANGCIYAHTAEGMKIDMMRCNPEVCFEVYRNENMSNWQSVIAWGRYEELDDAAERVDALKILLERELPVVSSATVHLTEDWPFVPDDLNQIKGVVFRIRLSKITGKYELGEDYNRW